VSFDDRGDLTLKVGNLEDGDVFEFVICSRALARASPVFRAMLFGGFSESKPEGEAWVVKLPEDRPAPFSILLKIIHGCFCEVPQSLTLEDIYQLLVVTNKYDMLSLASTWFAPYRNLKARDGNEKLLWMAWELGDQGAFNGMARDLVVTSEVNKEGQLLDSRGIPFNTYECFDANGLLDRFLNREVTEQL
ncbi:hypothetical protein BDP81DRAFT_328219, partial [Colletotrichum phormii]